MAELRVSQRVPQRCTECARRRVKCDKKVPCGRCTANRCAHLCVREIVQVRGKPAVATPIVDPNASLARQNSRLQERVAELELALMMSLRGRAMARPPRIGDASEDRQTPTSDHQTAPLEEVGDILDNWDLGPLKHEEVQNSASENDLLETLRSVPDRSTSTRIVKFSLEMCGWIHCALRADQFLVEHEAFQNALLDGTVGVLWDHKWMAIYFSVLTVGIFFMSEEDVSSLNLPLVEQGLDPSSVCHHWYRAAFMQLDYSDAMGKPQLHVVQVAAILTLCHSHFGQRHREINLLSLAQNTARALQMHRLGSETSNPKSLERLPDWSSETGRELGRRLWWTLVICDWLGGPRCPTSIPADSFDCVLSTGRYDYNVILGGSPLSDGVVVFSPLLHHIELARLSQVLHEYVQTSKHSPESLCEFLDRLDELEDNFVSKVDSLMASFREGINQGWEVPMWLLGQRSHYLCTVNFLRLIFCRALLQPSFSRLPAWSKIRSHGMRAALAIVHMENVPSTYRLLWVFGSSTIAAGVFLCLDLLTFPEDISEAQIREHRASVEKCITALQKYSSKTTICRAGSNTLRRLLDLELAQQDRPVNQADLTRLIKSIAHPSERGSPEPTINVQDQLLWSAPMMDQMDSLIGDGETCLPTVATSSFLETGHDQYWLMDSIFFPKY